MSRALLGRVFRLGVFLALTGAWNSASIFAKQPTKDVNNDPVILPAPDLPALEESDENAGWLASAANSSDGPTAEELRGLVPPAVEIPEPSAAPEIPSHLMDLARKVAPAVVSLRAWDAHGNELARSSGAFINERGAILTDMHIVHPEFAARIEYITVSTGTGTPHRITGYWSRDLDTGLTLLQSDASGVPFLKFRTAADFSKKQPVSIVAIHEERDLSLASAVVEADQSQAGDGWLNLRGDDSPGEPGSPVIDADGLAIAMVSMRVPQGKWFNFAARIDTIGEVLDRKGGASPLPLTDLRRLSPRPLTQDSRFLRAFQTLADGNASRATSQFLLLLKTHPRSAELWALLGLGFAKMGGSEEALNCNRKAVALDPRVGQYWYQLAISYLTGTGAQANLAAREALERTVEQRPADKIAWLLLAEQHLLGNNYSAAEAALLEVAKLDPDYPRASFLLGYAKGRQGDYAAAEQAMRRSLQLDRKQARAWFYLALLYTKQKRFPEAVSAYEEAVRIQPEHPSAWRNLALLHRRLGQDSAAGLAFERHRRLGVSVK